jgi:hypothetical protein
MTMGQQLKEVGGITLAQKLETDAQPDMPESAIESVSGLEQSRQSKPSWIISETYAVRSFDLSTFNCGYISHSFLEIHSLGV